MRSFKNIAEADIRDEDIKDVEEFEMAEYYEDLMVDIQEDLEDLREIMKMLGLKNEVASPLNEVNTTIGNIDDIIREEIKNYGFNAEEAEENDGKW